MFFTKYRYPVVPERPSRVGAAEQDVATTHAHLEALDAIGRIGEALATADVELVGVHGAGHHAAAQAAFAQRTVLVRAVVVDGVELAVDVEQGDGSGPQVQGRAGAGGDVVHPGDLDEFTHGVPPHRDRSAHGGPWLDEQVWIANNLLYKVYKLAGRTGRWTLPAARPSCPLAHGNGSCSCSSGTARKPWHGSPRSWA